VAIKEDAERVMKVAKHAFLSAIDYEGCIAILEVGNNSKVWDALNKAGADKVTKLIRVTLFFRVLMEVMREYDPPKPGDYHLRVGIDLLSSNKAVFRKLASKGNSKDLLAAIKEFNALDADPRRDKLRHLRNKQAAHLSDLHPTKLLPLILELESFAHGTSKVAELITHGTGIATASLTSQLMPFGKSAEAFWNRWLK
jgi:hypothetical protein